jgi:hypothetical protein
VSAEVIELWGGRWEVHIRIPHESTNRGPAAVIVLPMRHGGRDWYKHLRKRLRTGRVLRLPNGLRIYPY